MHFKAALWAGALGSFLTCLTPGDAGATTSDGAIKIGVLNDQSGPYADLAGSGSVEAAKMAIEDFGGKALGRPIELVAGDHQNKADVGAAIARRWFEQDGVDMIVDFSNTGVGLAVQALAETDHKIALITAASSDFTGKACTRTSAQWVYTSRTNGYGLARELTAKGAKSWFLMTVDYGFGQAFAADIRKAVQEGGGQVAGEVRFPLNTADMSSYLLQAAASNAQVVALAAAGSDMATIVKQAGEFGISQKQTLVAPIVFLTDVHAMGLAQAQGLQFFTAFYWDRDDASRAWSQRFFARHKAMPTMTQAGVYSAVAHYLKSVAATGTADAAQTMAKMHELKVNDPFVANGVLRADGQMIHDMYLAQVKTPAESKGPWDYYKILATVPGNEVFQSLAESECPLVH